MENTLAASLTHFLIPLCPHESSFMSFVHLSAISFKKLFKCHLDVLYVCVGADRLGRRSTVLHVCGRERQGSRSAVSQQ